MAQRKQIQLGTMRLMIRSLVSLSELRIRRCRELWCRLGSGVAVALAKAGSYSSDWTPSLRTSVCRGCDPKKTKNTKKKKRRRARN